MAWPVTAAVTPPPETTIEDSVLDITVGELEDEPIELEEEAEQVIPLDQPKKDAPIEETWDGVIRLRDLEDEILEVKRAVEDVAQTLEVDDAPTDVREAPPIELTQRVTESTGDLAEELERPQIPLFSDLPKSAFIELLVQMEMKEMMPGEYVITEGEVGDSFFVVANGKVRVSRKSDTGEEVTLAYLTDGAFFGEMALLQDGARTASVIVEEESQIFEISKDVLDRVVSAYPSVANVLKNFYRQRLLSTVMATHPLFRPFDAAQRRDLMEMFKSKPFKKGDVILQQGKKGAGLFLLLNGKLSVVKEADGKEIELAELGPGDLFGEMSLLTNQPTTASVTCVTDCFVLRLSKRNFDEVIMTHPQILELVAQVSEERKSFNEFLLTAQPMTASAGAILV
jgi:CRP-like cAMP-binding protein